MAAEVDAETLARVILGEGGLREQYPDDEDFLDAVERLKGELEGGGETPAE